MSKNTKSRLYKLLTQNQLEKIFDIFMNMDLGSEKKYALLTLKNRHEFLLKGNKDETANETANKEAELLVIKQSIKEFIDNFEFNSREPQRANKIREADKKIVSNLTKFLVPKIEFGVDVNKINREEDNINKEVDLLIRINSELNTYRLIELVEIFNYFKTLTKGNEPVRISEIYPGSVYVTFTMSESSFYKLMVNIDNEHLRNLGVDDISFVNANKDRSVVMPKLLSPNFRLENYKVLFKERLEKSLKVSLNELKNALLSDSPRFNELITILARFNETEKKYRIGEISAYDHSAELNKLTPTILGFIDLLEEQDIDIDAVQRNGYRS